MLFLDKFSLGEGFKRYFEFVPALNEATRRETFFIRHEVYCRELGFEPVRADQQERDEYDEHAVHCLLKTAPANPPDRLVGCTRLVLTPANDREALLPFEHYCRDTLDRRIVDPSKLPRESIAEVSRLAVMSDFRRRKGERRHEAPLPTRERTDNGNPRFPYIPVGLYLGTVALAQRQGIETLFILTEPRLADHFAKLGVKIKPIGGAINHRGTRIPSMMKVSEIVQGLRIFVRPIWRAINEQIDIAQVRQGNKLQ